MMPLSRSRVTPLIRTTTWFKARRPLSLLLTSPVHERSRHLPQAGPAQARSGGLGQRPALLQRADHRSPTAGSSSPAARSAAGKKKRADFLLRYTRDFTLAVVEAKSRPASPPATGCSRPRTTPRSSGLKFAYATNGTEIIEFDYFTGQERALDALPHARRTLAALPAGSRPRPGRRRATC